MTDVVDIGLAVDSRDVKSATKNLDKLGDQSKKTKSATDQMLSSFKKYASLAVVTAAVWKSIEAHREFTKSISELSAITGAMGNDLKFYSDTAKQLGRTTTFSASQVATAFKLVASAKPDLLESKEALAAVTGEVLTLAEASGMALPESATALGSALNQFGAGADQASRFINVLAAGAKFGASEINDTSLALKNVGAVASSLGLSFEESNAAIQALASVSIKGAEAGTGLRGVLLKLSTQSRDEFNPEIVGLAKALENLEAAELSTTEKKKLFGQESITAATALIKQASAVEDLTKKLTATDTAYKQASVNTDNLDGDIKSMESSWEGAALMLGETFDPALRFTVKLLRELGNVASSIVLAVRDMGQALGAYAAQAVELATLNLDGFKAISAAREIQRAENEKQLSDIWAEKEATDVANQAKVDATAKEVKLIDEVSAAKRMARSTEADAKATSEVDEGMSSVLAGFGDGEESIEMLIAQNELEREAQAEHREMMLEQEASYRDRLFNMETGSHEASVKFADALRKGDLKSAMQSGALALSNAAKQSKAAFAIQKALAMANAVVSLPSAIVKSFEAGGGYPWGLIPAGLMAAQGAAQISAISSASFGGGASSPSVSGGGGGSSAPSGGAGLPSGATATPTGLEEEPEKERKIIVEGLDLDSEYKLSGNILVEMLTQAARDGKKLPAEAIGS